MHKILAIKEKLLTNHFSRALLISMAIYVLLDILSARTPNASLENDTDSLSYEATNVTLEKDDDLISDDRDDEETNEEIETETEEIIANLANSIASSVTEALAQKFDAIEVKSEWFSWLGNDLIQKGNAHYYNVLDFELMLKDKLNMSDAVCDNELLQSILDEIKGLFGNNTIYWKYSSANARFKDKRVQLFVKDDEDNLTELACIYYDDFDMADRRRSKVSIDEYIYNENNRLVKEKYQWLYFNANGEDYDEHLITTYYDENHNEYTIHTKYGVEESRTVVYYPEGYTWEYRQARRITIYDYSRGDHLNHQMTYMDVNEYDAMWFKIGTDTYYSFSELMEEGFVTGDYGKFVRENFDKIMAAINEVKASQSLDSSEKTFSDDALYLERLL